jgi:hypothetical protein
VDSGGDVELVHRERGGIVAHAESGAAVRQCLKGDFEDGY